MDDKVSVVIIEADLKSKENPAEPHLHPLLINHIADTILSFLDATTLKLARQVNHLWKDEGAKHLIQTNFLQGPQTCDCRNDDPSTSPIDGNVDPDKIVALTSLITSSGPPHTVNLNVHIQDRNVDHHLSSGHQQQQQQHPLHITSQEIFWLCSHGHRIRHLKYSGRDSKLLYKILSLDNLKNLQILETNALNVSPAAFQHLSLEEGIQNDNNFWKKLEKIGQVRLNFCQSTSSLIEFAAFENSQRKNDGADVATPLNVTEVKFGWQFESVKEGLETYASFKLPWKIERLKIHLYPQLPVNLVRQFFEQISPYLKHLTVYLKADKSTSMVVMEGGESDAGDENCQKFNKPTTPSPPIDDWLIPWSLLSEVRTVEIAADKNCQNPSARLKMVRTALCLTKLKKLAIGEHIDEFLGQISNSHPFRPQSAGLQELEISLRALSSPTLLFEANLFPNLTRLLINFHRDFFNVDAFKYQDEDELNSFSFKAIYSSLEKLERFEVTYEDPNFECWGERWDEVVTGLKRPQGYQSGQDVTGQNDLKSSIRNLKDLKRFMLHDWNGNTVNRVTDFVIYNGLIHLKNIQSLHIYGHDFSKKAVTTLKATLGPNASVLIFST